MSNKLLSNFKDIALDLDGTLADTVKTHTQARLEAFAIMAAQMEDPRYLDISADIHAAAHSHGSSPLEIIAWVLREAKITDSTNTEEAQKVAAIKNEIYWVLASRGLPAMPGAVHLVGRLFVNKPGRLAIVTTAHLDTEVMPFLIKHKLARYFRNERIVSREHFNRTKPDPEPYDTLLSRLSLDPEKTMAVEDSPLGVESAKRAGMFVVGIATTHTPDQLEDHPYAPDLIADDHKHLASLLGL